MPGVQRQSPRRLGLPPSAPRPAPRVAVDDGMRLGPDLTESGIASGLPGAGKSKSQAALGATGVIHPLTDRDRNERLHAYESRVKAAFDQVVPVLQRIASERCETDFIMRAQRIANEALGFELPTHIPQNLPPLQLPLRRYQPLSGSD